MRRRGGGIQAEWKGKRLNETAKKDLAPLHGQKCSPFSQFKGHMAGSMLRETGGPICW